MNTKIILAVVLAVIVVAAWAVNAHRNKGFKTVSSEEFAGIIGDTATVQLLDVRTKEEYEEGHIADALLVDFYSYNFEEQATAKLSKEKPVAVYCRSGRRSASAASKLVKLGYEVINLDGGILAWQRAKMPIAKQSCSLQHLYAYKVWQSLFFCRISDPPLCCWVLPSLLA